MQTNGWLARIGGVLAIASLLLLPIGGCGGINMTGIDAFRALGNADADLWVKVLLGISLLCALGAIFLREAPAFFAAGAGGLIALIVAYTIARAHIPVELKTGSYLGILGFVLILAEGALQLRAAQTSAPPHNPTGNGTPPSSKPPGEQT